ncbi:hypothetical protein Tco_0277080 [Tanacetum coccineum]
MLVVVSGLEATPMIKMGMLFGLEILALWLVRTRFLHGSTSTVSNIYSVQVLQKIKDKRSLWCIHSSNFSLFGSQQIWGQAALRLLKELEVVDLQLMHDFADMRWKLVKVFTKEQFKVDLSLVSARVFLHMVIELMGESREGKKSSFDMAALLMLYELPRLQMIKIR